MMFPTVSRLTALASLRTQALRCNHFHVSRIASWPLHVIRLGLPSNGIIQVGHGVCMRPHTVHCHPHDMEANRLLRTGRDETVGIQFRVFSSLEPLTPR